MKPHRIAWRIFAAFVVLLCLPWPALADPATRGHPADCSIFADLAVTARALAAAKVDKSKAWTAISSMYQLNVIAREAIALQILAAAYRDNAPPPDFAGRLSITCHQNGGDLKTFFTPRPTT